MEVSRYATVVQSETSVMTLRPDTEERLVRALPALESLPSKLNEALNDNAGSKGELLRHGHQLADHEKRLQALEGEQKSHSQRSFVDMEKELERYRSGQTHWTRYVITAVVTLISGGLLLLLGSLIKGK